MDFRNNRHELNTRMIGLLATTFFLAVAIVAPWSWAMRMFFGILFGLQLSFFLRFVRNKIDLTSAGINMPRRSAANDPQASREEEFQYLKNIVHHAGTGLITYNSRGEIQIMNMAARRLLNLENADNITDLKQVSIPLYESILRLRTGGRDLVRTEVSGNIIDLAVYAIQLNLHEEEYKLISLQNIQSELEEKEMEAWHNLVRVLTHEIMNSVTPISSLANTVSEELQHQRMNSSGSDAEDLEDLVLALGTIKKRSEGLIRFVKDFRSLTRVPLPEISDIRVAVLLEEICVLLKKDLSNIQIKTDVHPADLVIRADKDQIEQVLINMIQNAIHALEDEPNPRIVLSGGRDKDDRPYLSVSDNGPGIEQEALEKIFIPFFTTKKRGSGIGLSLSRQIMRQHQGSISVKTVENEGTEFILRF